MTMRGRGRGAIQKLAKGAVGSLARVDRGRPDLLGVLTYHRLAPAGSVHARGIVSATPEGFARQMTMVANEYHPVSLADLVRRRTGGAALPRRSVLVTFDDAYVDFGDVAWPILRDLGIPTILFVPTAFPDAGLEFWWDRLHRTLVTATDRDTWDSPAGPVALTTAAQRARAYALMRERIKSLPHAEALALVDQVAEDLGADPGDRLADREQPADLDGSRAGGVMGWAALRALADDGCDLGAHSRTHPLLTRLRPDELRGEIEGSIADLARRLDRSPSPAFAYPSGATSPVVRDAAEHGGVEVAFTTDRGINDLRHCDWLAIRRINVGLRTDLALIRAQLDSRFGPFVGSLARRRRVRDTWSGRASVPATSGPG